LAVGADMEAAAAEMVAVSSSCYLPSDAALAPVAAEGGYQVCTGTSDLVVRRGVAWVSRQHASLQIALPGVPRTDAIQHHVAGSLVVLSTMLAAARCGRRRRRCGKDQSGLLRGAVQRMAQQKTATRRGFQVNDKYKGARSYGKVDEDDFEDAARVRSMFTDDIRSQQSNATQKTAEARKRMLRRRLKRGNVWQSSFSTPTAAVQLPGKAAAPQTEGASDVSVASGGDGGQEAASAEGAEGEEGEEGEEGDKSEGVGEQVPDKDAYDLAAVGEKQDGNGETSDGKDVGKAFFPGLAEVNAASPPRDASFRFDNASAPKVPLSSAKRLVDDDAARRRCPGRQLAAAASTLSTAGQHEGAAVLLRYLRDFGVEQDIIQRRLSFAEADALFQEAAVRLGLELQLAGQLYAAWDALLAACAEEQMPQAGVATEALTHVAMKLSANLVNQPAKQVEILQAAADAAALNRSLKRDRQDELELTLALSLQGAGNVEASKELLQRLQRRASSERRRQQAAWALTVQSVDISGERSAASVEMSALWNDLAPVGGAGSGVGAAAVSAALQKRRRSGGGISGLGFGGLGSGPAFIVAVVLLAVPLAIPLVAGVRGASSIGGS